MGIIRGGIITLLSVLLLLTLFTGNIFATVSGSLEYNQLKPSLINVSKEVITEYNLLSQLEQMKPYIQMYCLTNDKVQFNESGLNIDIPCSVALLDTNTIIEYGVTQLVDQLYYKQYDCEFWQCVKEQNPPLVLISEKSYEYWRAFFYWSIILSVIFFMLIFLIAKNKATPFIISGILMILTALPFKSLNWVFSLIPIGEIAKFLSIFFMKSHSVFLVMLILGILLLVFGIALKLTGLGKRMSWNYKEEEENKPLPQVKPAISKKEIKKIVNEEIQKKEIKNIVNEEINKSQQGRKKKK